MGSADADAPGLLGWDIGGVHVKVARVVGGAPVATRTRALALLHEAPSLATTLRELAAEVAGDTAGWMAVTMTGECSQRFRTKAEGVHAIMDAVREAFPEARLRFFTTQGQLQPEPDARRDPIGVASANWLASGIYAAVRVRRGILVDVGSTTTDLIPIVNHRVRALGRTDPGRLEAGELLYTGAVRTPIEAIVPAVPLARGMAPVSADGFATVADAHVWRGRLDPALVLTPTADGRPATRDFAGERLARTVLGDRTLISDALLDGIAAHVARAQVETIAAALHRLVRRWPELDTAIVAGIGAWIGAEAAALAGLAVRELAADLGDAATLAPAVAVALLLERQLTLGMM